MVTRLLIDLLAQITYLLKLGNFGTTIASPFLNQRLEAPYLLIFPRALAEFGLNLNPNCLGEMVIGILNDPRGWSTVENQSFQIVDKEDADLNIVFAKPETVDELCYPLQTNGIYSCRNEKNVVINMFRWVSGAKDFDKDLSTYRIYLINHEVGHYLGWGHSDCPSENALAPVMMQQSKTTDGCIPNGWPIYERVKLLYSSP